MEEGHMTSNYTATKREITWGLSKERATATIPFLDEALGQLHINLLQKIIFINVTDLVFCPRQVSFGRLSQIPENQNQDKYLIGRLLTVQLQQILVARYPGRFEIEKQVQYNCSNYDSNLGQGCIVYVFGKIDAFNKEVGPYEFKSTKSAEKVIEPKSYDVQQIKYYMAMTNSMTGVLLYYHLDHKFAHDPSVKFPITMTEEELYSEHEKLVVAALSLSEAISAKRPEMAQHIAFDRNLAWKCKSCPYSGDCKDMRIAANGFKSKINEPMQEDGSC
jgi:CRISPR/Cas system-associated exonuclease Cas4 (RecB family)